MNYIDFTPQEALWPNQTFPKFKYDADILEIWENTEADAPELRGRDSDSGVKIGVYSREKALELGHEFEYVLTIDDEECYAGLFWQNVLEILADYETAQKKYKQYSRLTPTELYRGINVLGQEYRLLEDPINGDESVIIIELPKYSVMYHSDFMDAEDMEVGSDYEPFFYKGRIRERYLLDECTSEKAVMVYYFLFGSLAVDALEAGGIKLAKEVLDNGDGTLAQWSENDHPVHLLNMYDGYQKLSSITKEEYEALL